MISEADIGLTGHEDVSTIIAKFRARWPHVFTWPQPKPLALDIFADIFFALYPADARDPAWRTFPSARAISAALGSWCSRTEYLQACSVRGADRFDLNGRAVGKVDALQARYAQDELAQRTRNRTVTVPQLPPAYPTEPMVYMIGLDHPYLKSIQPGIFRSGNQWYVKHRNFFGTKVESIDFDTKEEAEAYAQALQTDRRIRVYDHEDFAAADARWRAEAAAELAKPAKRKTRKERAT